MGISTIDGTIEVADLRRKAVKVSIFRKLVFHLADGSTKTVANAHVHNDVAIHLTPGASGRFYLFNSMDHRGLCGLRTADGRSIIAYPKNNEVIGIVLLVVGILWVGSTMLFAGGIPILGSIVLIIAVLVTVVNGNLRRQAERHFAADAAPVPPAAAAAEPAIGA